MNLSETTSQETSQTTNQAGKRPPKAPRDPKKKRSSIYIMLDQMIQSVSRGNGIYSTEIYLDSGRLVNKAKVTGGVEDESILNMLADAHTFKQLVHSIGVTVTETGDVDHIHFVWMNYGVHDRSAGTRFEMDCPTDGAEYILDISDTQISDEDGVTGQCYFDFFKPNTFGKVTVKLYLNDGYSVPELMVDPPVEWGGAAYQKVISKSMVQLGNVYRIKKVIEKARAGEDVTIAFIGGSITQGAGAVPIQTECYAYKMFQWFVKQYATDPDKCHYVKAGVGGTSSELGLIRYERDVISFGSVKPDLVIVEFAVNDEGDETLGDCHESLLIRILSEAQKPGIIMLFSVFADDCNLQDRLEPIGRHYDFPMVSLSDALVAQFKKSREEGNVITKRQYYYDIFHPSNMGHTVMADCLKYLIDQADHKEEPSDLLIKKIPAIGCSYPDVHLLDRSTDMTLEQNILSIEPGGFTKTDQALQCVDRNLDLTQTPQFPHNWMHTKESSAQAFTIKVKAKSLFAIFKDSDDVSFGKVTLTVDGQFYKEYDPLEVGWTHCNAVLLFHKDNCEEHEVTIQMAETDAEKNFTILGFGIVK
ncbi:MAG: SGNH/GDSL hydrolase family protein [Clostridia bacterium]|nr:SGNH/GDSL hydrolase family protein [Clostridia bacterium]